MAPSSSSSSSDLHVYTWMQKVASAFGFGIISFIIVFTNKFVLGDPMKCSKCYGFPSVKFLAFAQCVASCLVMIFQKYILGHLFGNEKYKNLFPPLSWSIVRQINPLPLLFFLNMVSGLSATKSLNIPMFVLLRRFSIAMTLALEFYILKKGSTRVIVSSVGLMLLGAMIASADDATLDMYSAFYILMNDLLTALQGVTLKLKMNRATANEQHQQNHPSPNSVPPLTTDGILFYNSLLSSLPALIWFLASPGELDAVMHFKAWTKAGFVFWFAASMFLGFVLNYSYFLCTKYNSALTSTVVGSAKNCISSYVGMMLGDYHFTPLNFVGVNVSMFAAILYAYGELHRQNHHPPVATNNQTNSSSSSSYTIVSVNNNNNNSNNSTHNTPIVVSNNFIQKSSPSLPGSTSHHTTSTPLPLSGNRLMNNNNTTTPGSLGVGAGGAAFAVPLSSSLKTISPAIKGNHQLPPSASLTSSSSQPQPQQQQTFTIHQRSPPVKGFTVISTTGGGAGGSGSRFAHNSNSSSTTSSPNLIGGGVTVVQHPNLIAQQQQQQQNNAAAAAGFHFHTMKNNKSPPNSPTVVVQTISSGNFNNSSNNTSASSGNYHNYNNNINDSFVTMNNRSRKN